LRNENCSKKLWAIRLLTIRYLHFALFSDMSMGHKISSHDRVSALLHKAQVQDIEKGRVSSTEKVQAFTSGDPAF
jgi:hypothetical protein